MPSVKILTRQLHFGNRLQYVKENGLSKDSHLTTSNHLMSINSVLANLKGEETVHQIKDNMDIEQENSLPSIIGQEEANNHHVFR